MTAPNDEASRDLAGSEARSGHPGRETERLEASHDLAAAWGESVVDLTLELAGRRARIDTSREAERDERAEPWTASGRVGRGTFTLELPRQLVDLLVSDLPDEVDADALSANDGALVLEHVLSEAFGDVEGEIGEPIELTALEPGALVTELEPLLATVMIERQRHHVRAAFGDPLHMRILTEWLRPMRMPDEFAAGEATRVEVGPIELALDDLDALEVGDAIAIGTEPGQNLLGRLVRDTGRMVPVTIDTAQVVVEGPVEEPVAHDPNEDPAALGVEIGAVRLSPSHLMRARKGARFIMERNESNVCALRHGDDVVARGELTLIEGRLGVEIASLGDGPMPARAKAAAPSLDPGPAEAGVERGELEPLEGDSMGDDEPVVAADTFRVG